MSHKIAPAIRVTPIIIGSSRRNTAEPTESGLTIAVIPKINAILAMFEPRTLPTAVSVFPSRAAVAETIISGAEEPIARIVIPITKGEMPILRANAADPNTNLSAPQTRIARPINRKTTASISMLIPT
ncbi:Uncharacterised protein [Vibrio cholerae]|nr:Uncharacterised protein [Vibrio cholerae]CSI58627.1 Uncharacterised protein [Vibrio cholerae]